MGSYYEECLLDAKKHSMETNKDFVESIRNAIKENNIGEFFSSLKFKPRYVDITEVLLYFPDGEDLVLGCYDYFISHIRPMNIPDFLLLVNKRPRICQLIIRDCNEIIDKVEASDDMFNYRIIKLATALIEIPECEQILLSRIEELLQSVNPTCIDELYGQFENTPYYKDIYLRTYAKYLLIARGNSVIGCLRKLIELDLPIAMKFINENLIDLMNNCGEGLVAYLINMLAAYEELHSLLKDNIDNIIDCCNAREALEIMRSLDDKLELGLYKKNDVIETLQERLSITNQGHPALGAIIKAGRNEQIKDIISSLLEEENVLDYHNIGIQGSWSNIVFKIGNKVLKIGWIRNNPQCENHYRVIKPLYFETIYDKNGNPVLYIEIQDYLYTVGFGPNDINNLLVDIASDGLVYVDPRGADVSNFGLLNKDKAPSENVSDSFKKLPLVLIDRDCLWKKDDKNIVYMHRY